MSLTEAQLYEAGLALPPEVRKHVALRLLESVGEDITRDVEPWLQSEVAAAHDALEADPARAVPADEVRARFEERWAARP